MDLRKAYENDKDVVVMKYKASKHDAMIKTFFTKSFRADPKSSHSSEREFIESCFTGLKDDTIDDLYVQIEELFNVMETIKTLSDVESEDESEPVKKTPKQVIQELKDEMDKDLRRLNSDEKKDKKEYSKLSKRRDKLDFINIEHRDELNSIYKRIEELNTKHEERESQISLICGYSSILS